MPLNKVQIVKSLADKIHQTVEKSLANQPRIAVAFSGGVDSSLLAKVCQDCQKEVILLTIGFPGAGDIECARKVADQLRLPLLVKEINSVELEQEIFCLAKMVVFPGVRDFEVVLSLSLVFKFAAEQNLPIILTATGLDALFCGFDRTRQLLCQGNRQELDKLNLENVRHAQKMEKDFDFLARRWRISRINPFLNQDFVDFALKIPSEYKVLNGQDQMRKHILREAAISIGVPKIAALRPKKAIQYSTKIDRVLKKMAKQAGVGSREDYLRNIFMASSDHKTQI